MTDDYALRYLAGFTYVCTCSAATSSTAPVRCPTHGPPAHRYVGLTDGRCAHCLRPRAECEAPR